MKALDWIGRTLLLILSTMATLSLIGSIAELSQRPPGPPHATVPQDRVARDSAAGGGLSRPAGAPAATPSPAASPVPAEATGEGAFAEAPPVSNDTTGIARWLRALTYAVLALAGFAAAALLVLLRIAAHLARIADRS